jgi:hypothetical protein
VSKLAELPPCPVCEFPAHEWECTNEYGKPNGWAIGCVRNASLDHEMWVAAKTRRAARTMWRRTAR